MGRFNDQMSRMKSLMNYGVVSENTNNGNHSIEFTAEAADGKVYGIVREGTKFYIKRTEKGKESLTESFDYIGGWNNRKDYEYSSYNNALKQFELKVRSINEAITGKGDFNAFDLDKKENLVIECTEKMGKEIARQREIMSRVGERLTEATISCSNTGVPEAPKTTSFSAKLGKPFDETATATLDKDMTKTASDPKKQSEPFGETEKAEDYKDAQYVPDNSVANKKPSGGKVVRVNEEKEDWASQGLPATPGVGSPDGHLMEGDDIVDGESFQGNNNPEVVEEDAPLGFAEEDEFESVEGDEVMDDDTIEMDDDIEDVEGDELDADLEGTDELGGEDLDLGDEDELESDDEIGDGEDDRISELEDMIQMIMDELGLDADEISDGEDSEEDLGDEDDLYDDEESEDNVDLDEPEFDDEEIEGDAETEFPMESKQAVLDRLVEAVSSNFYRKNKPNSQGTIAKIEKAKSMFAAAIQNDLGNREDSELYSDLGYYDEDGNLMDSQEDADDLLELFNQFADMAISFYNATMPKYKTYKGATQLSNLPKDDLSETDEAEVNAAYDQVAELYVTALTEYLDVRNQDLLDVDSIMDDDGLLPYGGDITKAVFVGPDKFIEGVDGQVLVQDNNFGEYSPYYVYMFYAVMKAVNKLKFNFEYFYDKLMRGRELAADDAMVANTQQAGEEMYNKTKGKSDDDFHAAAEHAAAELEKTGKPLGFESRKARKTMKEDKLNDFGKHPGYRKKPMNLPPTGEDKNQWGRDWNDESVYSEEPFGSKIGSSAPFDIVQHVTDSIMEQLKKKR